jgi:glycosyltransferase involved in cell wall biosynthesis
VKRVLINGRFLGQRTTGVQRYARELLGALDRLLFTSESRRRELRFEVLTPPGTSASLALEAMDIQEVGRLTGHLWEQVDLARHVGGNLLLNLANTAPLAARSTITTIYDASVYAVPGAYSLPFRTWYRLLLPATGRRARRVVTCSEFSRLELERYAGIDRANTTVIYGSGEHVLATPPDETVLNRLGLRSRPYILAVSSRSEHKNLAGLERAASLLGDRDLKVVLAGGENSGVFRPERTCEGNGVQRTGYVTNGELRALYQNAACFVYPSFYEGFGLPPLEAMACGCPVVVSRAASLPEVCGDAAVYCDPHSDRDIAEAMERVMNDVSLRDNLRRKGTEHSARFTWKQSAESMLKVIEKVTAG